MGGANTATDEVPAEQPTQVARLVPAELVDWYVPAGQPEQLAEDAPPGVVEKVPEGHEAQLTEPPEAAYLPAAQPRQLTDEI